MMTALEEEFVPVSQEKLLREALQRGERLNRVNAMKDYGVGRLASRISELKRRGLNIKSEKVPYTRSYDKKTVYISEYWL